jgi:succinoglycan biosynthesis transport protein ExoP
MAGTPAPPAAKFRPQKFLYFLRKFWWIPLITLTLSLGVAAVMFYRTPPTFVSYGSMWETEKLTLPDGAAFSDDGERSIGTLSDLLRSPRMWDLTTNYMLADQKNLVVMNKDGFIIPVAIQVYASTKSSVYTIEARSSNPGFTPAFLNALMEQYKEYRLNSRGAVSVHTISSISEQVQVYERDLKAAQMALADYEQSNNFAVLQEESTIEASYLAKLKTDLSDYQLQLKLLAAKELEPDSNQVATNNSTDTIFDSLHDSKSGTSLVNSRLDADKQIELLQLERDRLAKYMRPKHPKMVELDKSLAAARKTIEVDRRQSHDQIMAAREALQIKIGNTEFFIKQWEDKVADANARLAKADGLKQEIASKQRMYDRLSALNDNVQVGQHIDQDTLDILHKADPATRSYAEIKTIGSQSVIVGLGLGLGIVFLIAFRDDRFGSLIEVTENFGDNVVGQVPEAPQMSGNQPIALLEGNDDRHMYAESYRNLRSALLYLAVDGQRPKVLLITSAVPNEGKSTVATNLARALVLGGSKVLLIDGDLRKGRIHELLKLPSKPGLNELLRQNEEPGKFIQATDLPDFAFLARGSASRNPGDLFLSPAFDQMLARFRQQYDFVLIDSSPIFAADDTSSIAPKVDGTLFVVRSRFSHARVVREALEILFQRQARVLGLILNRTDASSRAYYFYKYGEDYASVPSVDADVNS